ncbi:MAG: glycosyltransferase [Desulfobacterales bacterium]|nr:glycosyltransferase [Desulfobacterales bacterium]
MDAANNILGIWVLATAAVLMGLIIRGMRGATAVSSERASSRFAGSVSPCEVLVPVAGTFPDQESILSTLLTQDHPTYRVLFIVENENDPANPTIDKLCRSHRHAEKVLSGRASSCGQKNHNLIAGIHHLKPETEIIVFCDSRNIADPGWLMRFTRPLQSDPNIVVTTFRDFNPTPATLGGVCQAIYGSFLLVLPRIRPSPWGGGTAMYRRTLEKLNVIEAWSQTVVDDVVLGRLLYEHSVPMIMDRVNRLDSPLGNQTVWGFLSYLERQILYPKFIDPVLWVGPMVFHLNLTLATAWALFSVLSSPFNPVGALAGLSGLVFLMCEAGAALMLRAANRHRVPAAKWLLSLYPCILFGALAFLKSIFLREIRWQGRRYPIGRKGVVIEADVRGPSKTEE